MPTTLRQCACDPRQILVAVISKMAVQAAQDKHESEALAAEARRALADAHALPGMRDDLTEEQRLDPAVRAPTATERADGLCLYALALHRSSTASQEAHEVCARCRATCRPLFSLCKYTLPEYTSRGIPTGVKGSGRAAQASATVGFCSGSIRSGSVLW